MRPRHRLQKGIFSGGDLMRWPCHWVPEQVFDVAIDYVGTVTRVGLYGGTVTGDDVSQFEILTEIEEIDFMNALVGPEAFRSLRSLSTVKILLLFDSTFDQQDLRQVMHELKLIELGLNGTKINDELFQGIRQVCPTLEQVDLRGTAVTDETCRLLSDLPKLRVLMLSDTKITDTGLLSLAGAPKLRRVYVDGMSVSSEAISRLHATRPDIDVQTMIR
jgi:Leucine Rich repeat